MIKPIKRYGFIPRRIITDKLLSYSAAKREVAPGLDHWSHKGLNNRAENSHLLFASESEQCGGSEHRVGCSDLFPFTHQPAIASLLHPAAMTADIIIWKHSMLGKRQQTSPESKAGFLLKGQMS